MKKKEILKELRKILDNDNDDMNEEFLYENIKNSYGNVEKLARLFVVPDDLIRAIKKIEDPNSNQGSNIY